MAETQNISRMAEKLADEIFLEFKWQKEGVPNANYGCITPAHQKRTHPADVVFSYKDPYSELRHYVQVDLKSYTGSSISPANVIDATVSLGKAVDCAPAHQEWKTLFGSDGEEFDVVGMLFVFNHDDSYEHSFSKLLEKVAEDRPALPSGARVHIVGPDDIIYLNSICNDMQVMRGKNKIPSLSECGFYYPDLSRTKVVMDKWGCPATIEVLKGAWQILKYPEKKMGGFSIVIYYRGKGETVDEFTFLIDMLVHYQLMSNMVEISVRAPFATERAPAVFHSAVRLYAEPLREKGVSSVSKIENLRLEIISTVIPKFSEYQVGLDER